MRYRCPFRHATSSIEISNRSGEPVAVQELVADALDDPPDRVPVDPRQPAGCRLVGLRRQPRHEALEVASEARAVAGERDTLDQRAVLGTAQPPEPGVDLEPPDPEIEMPPDRVVTLAALTMPRRIRAARARQPATAQRHHDHDPVGLEADRPNPHPAQAQQTRECSSDAHGRRPPGSDCQKPRTYGPNPCASLNPLRAPRNQRTTPAQATKRPLVSRPESPTIIHGAPLFVPMLLKGRGRP